MMLSPFTSNDQDRMKEGKIVEMKSPQRNSQGLLALAAKLARLGPWRFHPDRELFEFDDDFYAIYATDSVTEGTYMSLADYIQNFVHPDYAARVRAEADKMLNTSQSVYFAELDHCIMRRDGIIRTVSVRITVEKDKDGKILNCYGVNQDISDQVELETALQNSRNALSMAAKLAHLGPWVFHLNEGVFEFSDEFYAIFASDVDKEGRFMSPEKYCKEFVHPEDWWIFGSNEVERNYVHRIIRRDGEERIISVQGQILRDNVGEVVSWCGAVQDITEQKRAEAVLQQQTEKIHRIAFTDPLTHLSNRTHLTAWLEQEMEQSRLGKSTGSILLIDLDDLKTINDTLGHTYGDALIIETGKRIKKEAAPGDFVGRIGGDEFAMVMPGKAAKEEVAIIMNRLVQVIAQEVEVGGDLFQLSASMGVATYPRDGDTVEEILKNVDNAMYYAKTAGKNCWKFFDDEMRAAAYENLLLTKSLRQAVGNDELALHYQPQIKIATGEVVGFEALLRWNSKEFGSVSPLRFIPVAENTGLIKIIGPWVLNEACRFAQRLADKGRSDLHVAVNVSPHQLCADNFVKSVKGALTRSGISPHQLEIEITENALMTSLTEAIDILETLRSMGVRLALDDFGTGYSSLTYLQKLPVHTLKLDKAFIDMILGSDPKLSMLVSIMDMAHQMQMSVVAEGVEFEKQLDFLAKNQCDLAQGYLFSRPMPEDAILQKF